jgi:hypothetical protein
MIPSESQVKLLKTLGNPRNPRLIVLLRNKLKDIKSMSLKPGFLGFKNMGIHSYFARRMFAD